MDAESWTLTLLVLSDVISLPFQYYLCNIVSYYYCTSLRVTLVAFK